MSVRFSVKYLRGQSGVQLAEYSVQTTALRPVSHMTLGQVTLHTTSGSSSLKWGHKWLGSLKLDVRMKGGNAKNLELRLAHKKHGLLGFIVVADLIQFLLEKPEEAPPHLQNMPQAGKPGEQGPLPSAPFPQPHQLSSALPSRLLSLSVLLFTASPTGALCPLLCYSHPTSNPQPLLHPYLRHFTQITSLS